MSMGLWWLIPTQPRHDQNQQYQHTGCTASCKNAFIGVGVSCAAFMVLTMVILWNRHRKLVARMKLEIQYDSVLHRQQIDPTAWNQRHLWTGYWENTQDAQVIQRNNEQWVNVGFGHSWEVAGMWTLEAYGAPRDLSPNDRLRSRHRHPDFVISGLFNPHNGQFFLVKDLYRFHNEPSSPIYYVGEWNQERQSFIGHWKMDSHAETGAIEFGPFAENGHDQLLLRL